MSVKKLFIIPTTITNVWLRILDYTPHGVPIIDIDTINISLEGYFEEIGLLKGDLVFLEAYPHLNYLLYDGKCLTKIIYEDDIPKIPKNVYVSLQIIGILFIIYLLLLCLL